MKSDGDFEDILAADNPDVWVSNRPAEGGEAGAMLAKIIERAAALKAGRAARSERRRQPRSRPRAQDAAAAKRAEAAATGAKTATAPPNTTKRHPRKKARA